MLNPADIEPLSKTKTNASVIVKAAKIQQPANKKLGLPQVDHNKTYNNKFKLKKSSVVYQRISVSHDGQCDSASGSNNYLNVRLIAYKCNLHNFPLARTP